tara:strand:- start:73 stop:270 length:198 start_codon:yes stop_codon:yes gene_type:complete
MTQDQVVELMKGSKSEIEWNTNCNKVKKACGGYPDFWYTAIVLSGIAAETAKKFGGSADITITTL